MDSRINTDEIKQCIKTLESLLADRRALSALSAEERKALLIAAGRVSRPEKQEIDRLLKANRRERKRRAREADRVTRAATGIREARKEKVYIPPALAIPATDAPVRELEIPRNCYVCKVEFKHLHFFYDSMCKACGDYNYAKRFQTA